MSETEEETKIGIPASVEEAVAQVQDLVVWLQEAAETAQRVPAARERLGFLQGYLAHSQQAEQAPNRAARRAAAKPAKSAARGRTRASR